LNRVGTLRVIDASVGQQCTRLETAISWNQQGPTGPAGPPGPAGLTNTRLAISDVFDAPANTNSSTGEALCTGNERVVGGGLFPDVDDVGQDGRLVYSGPVNDGTGRNVQRWRAGYNPGVGDSTFTVVAVCASP
jgi:hypothetical protein